MNKTEELQESRLKVLNDEVDRIQTQSTTQTGSCQVNNDKLEVQIKQYDTKVTFDINSDKQNMKDNEVRVGKVIDEKLYSLRLELAKEKKVREESHEQYLEIYGRQINQINEAIDEENKER